jgi:phosphatidylglycerol---prolipoprotein diacylglyceryl transferase
MYNHTIDPVFLQIGPLEIRYYGLVYAIGLIFLYFYLIYITKKKEIPNFKEKDVENFLVGLMILLLVGARIFHVFIYNWQYYLSKPGEILLFWRGGLSFHGGLLFATIWIYYFAHKKKIDFLRITDALVIPIALILSLGRIANFINSELVGIITNSRFGVKFPGYEGFRHPTQLYESIKNFSIFIVLIAVSFIRTKVFKKYLPGLLTVIFLISYGIFRFLIEFLKETNQTYSRTTGQILSILVVLAGITINIYINKKSKKSKR